MPSIRTPLTVEEIIDDPLVNRVQEAVGDAAAETKFVQQRRNSLAGVAGTILQLANLLALVSFEIPWWGTAIIAVIIGLAEVIIHATSKTPVTQAVAEKVTEKARERSAVDHLAAVPTPPAPRYSLEG